MDEERKESLTPRRRRRPVSDDIPVSAVKEEAIEPRRQTRPTYKLDEIQRDEREEESTEKKSKTGCLIGIIVSVCRKK